MFQIPKDIIFSLCGNRHGCTPFVRSTKRYLLVRENKFLRLMKQWMSELYNIVIDFQFTWVKQLLCKPHATACFIAWYLIRITEWCLGSEVDVLTTGAERRAPRSAACAAVMTLDLGPIISHDSGY